MDFLFSVKWQDVADVLVISFLIHRLFLLIRGTTAFQITLGLLFLWLCQSLAQTAGFVLTSWFFQGFGAVAVLVIIVVFRNEIREALIQTNPIRLFLGHPHEPQTIDLPALERTTFQLAKAGAGALLVFQQRDRLSEHLREGVPLEGKLSPEIIVSIFTKQSPVHDGAAIIQGDRIKLVGTYLPLTKKEGLPQHYGTRHRAAIGLSEISDAVVLVVSEEREEVSVVHRGRVEVVHEPPQLQTTLGDLLSGAVPRTEPRSRGREFLSQAGGLVLTFLLVSTFWGIYSGKQLSLINVTAAVDFRNIPQSLELKRSSAEKVEVQITGKRRLVSALKPEQVGAFVDLHQIDAGYHQVALNAANIELPLGLEVVRISPSIIRLDMEQRVEKKIAVKPKIVGSPPDGYQLESFSVSPESVLVNGPTSVLRKIKNLATEPVALGELVVQDAETVVEVPLILSPPSLRLLEGERKRVLIKIQLKPQDSLAIPTQERSKAQKESEIN